MNSCKFCLKTLDNSKHEILDEKCTEMLKGLSIKLDLNNCNQAFICDDCLEKLKNAYKFKMELVNKETPIFSYVRRENKEVDLTAIHKNETDTCTFCGNSAINCSALESVEEHQLNQIFKKHIPEVNMDGMQNSDICESCCLAFHQCLDFFSTFSLTEENKKYVIKEEVFGNEHISLPIFEEKIIKEEFEPDPGIFKSDFNFIDTKKEPDKKDEHTLTLFSNVTQMHDSLGDRLAIKQDEIQVKAEDSENDSTQAVLKKNGYEDVTCTNGKSLDCHSSSFLAIDKTVLDEKIYRCVICSYTTKYKGNLKRHTLIHEHISDVEIYQCDICEHKTKYKSYLKQHMSIHTDRRKQVHTNISDIKMYLCEICSRQFKYKHHLTEHMLTHKNNSEVMMYHCAICTYETKFKMRLKSHMSNHKTQSEVAMHHCEACGYETKFRSNLMKHLLIHETSYEKNYTDA